MLAVDRALLWAAERQLVPALCWSIGLCAAADLAGACLVCALKLLLAWGLGGAVMWWRGNVLVREAGRR